MIRICLVTPDALAEPTANEYYRTLGPLLDDPSAYSVTRVSAPNWSHIADCDLVAFTCPTTEAELKALELAEASGIPTWVDYSDENLFELPEAHPRYLDSMQEWFRATILTFLDRATLVTVATEGLREVYQLARNTGTVEVVADGLPTTVRRARTHNRSDVFGWVGTEADIHNLLPVADYIARAIPESARVSIHGWHAWPLTSACIDRHLEVAFTKPQPLPLYFKSLADTEVACLLVPLLDTQYNRARSNRLWLEATAIGAVVLAPEWWGDGVPALRYTHVQDDFPGMIASFLERDYVDNRQLWLDAELAALKQTIDAAAARKRLLAELVEPNEPPLPPPTPLAARTILPVTQAAISATIN